MLAQPESTIAETGNPASRTRIRIAERLDGELSNRGLFLATAQARALVERGRWTPVCFAQGGPTDIPSESGT